MITYLKDIFRKLKKSPTERNGFSNEGEKEYVFIWYKKMQTGNKTYYTQPFRTKVKGRTRDEASEKLQSFVIGKMSLMIHDEADYDKSSLGSMQKGIDDLSKTFDDLNRKMESFFKKG